MVNVIGKLILLSLLKKVSIFVVAKTYGFPRLYRRLMECNRRLIKNEPTRKRVRDQVQYLFRLPRRWMQLVQNKLHGSTGLGIENSE
ncbi:hypothetical protein Gasu2_26000 [Galdieria sulphuraria]|nr:hypothetical protein Gasu2_26000 [Galdieria sulphuraria]